MKRTLFFLVPALVALAARGQEPFQKIAPLKEKLRPLPFGAVRPEGWLKTQIRENLDGFTGHLDSLVPDLILKDDIYGRDRLTPKVKSKDVGAVADGGDWQVQFLWWNSETQSNWRDGYLRSALLLRDSVHLRRLRAYVDRILATQDADGYLGIYAPALRYQFDNENGELWAQATLFRGLLAWYEATGEQRVLKAVERAVALTMKRWPAASAHPFRSVNPNVGGLSHGLMFTDVLESLYRLTGRGAYRDYALFLYRDFSAATINEDAQYQKLLNASLPLKGHGVHTYEHLRSVAAAYYASGNPALRAALDGFLQKIARCTVPSGGPIGDEWIGGGTADATKRGYEYCSLQELQHSYSELLLKSGGSRWGDEVERIFFNAAQGARHPRESSIAYLKTDDAYAMTGGVNGDTSGKQVRYKYSPVHQDAAVCCVPNAGRVAPYFVQYMWAQDGEGLVAALLGPATVHTSWKGAPLTIRTQTEYPYNYKFTYTVEGARPGFVLKIRRPAWAKSVKLNVPYTEADGYLVVHRAWKRSEQLELELEPEAAVATDGKGAHYFTWGPLVLAHPLAADSSVTKTFPLPGFRDLHYRAERPLLFRYAGPALEAAGPLRFRIQAIDPQSGATVPLELEPMGGTVLRQVTFQ